MVKAFSVIGTQNFSARLILGCHAGAIIHEKAGTAENKIREFEAAGVSVANRPSEISTILAGLV